MMIRYPQAQVHFVLKVVLFNYHFFSLASFIIKVELKSLSHHKRDQKQESSEVIIFFFGH